MKKTRKSLVLSIVTLLLCSCMFIGSTLAWFTDSVSNTGNRIQAGTLKVDLLMDKGDGYKSIAGKQGDIFKEAATANNSLVTLWEPGKTQFVKLAVENKGNLALKYNLYIDTTDEGLVGSLEYAILPSGHVPPATEPATLGNWAALKAAAGEDAVGTLVAGRTQAPANGFGTLDEIVNGVENERDYFILAVHMKEDAGNEYQGKDAIIDVCVVATQATAEKDGFGSDQYDAGAAYDEIPAPIHEKAEKTIPDNPGSADINFETQPDSKIENANIQGEAANKILGDAKKDTNPEDKVTVDLSMNIDTAEKTSNSITFDITLEKVVKVNDVVNDAKSGLVTDLGDKVASVTLNVGTGLSNVKVNRKHDGTSTALDKLTSADEKKDGFFYDGATGKLTITSSKYSDFICEYGICNHEHITEWTCDAKYHTAVCPECGTTVKEEHVFVNGVCSCGYKSDAKLLEENPNFTCRIGNTGYERLFSENVTGKKDSALKSAKSGDTIIAIADYTTTNSALSQVKNNDFILSIDLNGKVLNLGSARELNVGTYNIYDSSSAKTGEIVKGITLSNNQQRLNTTIVNIYGGKFGKVATGGDNGDKTLNICGGNICLVEVQGSEWAGPEGTPEHRHAIDKVNIQNGSVGYISCHSSVADKYESIFQLANGYSIGAEITGEAEKAAGVSYDTSYVTYVINVDN